MPTNDTAARRYHRPRNAGPATEVKVDLEADDLAALDRIAGELAIHRQSTPNRALVLRWAIRELSARLELAEMSRGAAPCFTEPGPMVPPP
jgi:hypothetical protein